MRGLRLFIVLTILTGLIYPLLITLIGQTIFSESSNGRLDLIGQKFDQPKYFWPRPSAIDYNPLSSGGSNLSATSKALAEAVAKRKEILLASDPTKTEKDLPADLLFASGSGLDPDISLAAANFQAERVARERKLDKQIVLTQIDRVKDGNRVNVLPLNRLMDSIGK